MLVIEIISPDDRYSEVQEKLAEYERWEVPHICVVDPHRRTLATDDVGALSPASRLALPGYPAEFSSNLFSWPMAARGKGRFLTRHSWNQTGPGMIPEWA